jgi:hypothetical protein
MRAEIRDELTADIERANCCGNTSTSWLLCGMSKNVIISARGWG